MAYGGGLPLVYLAAHHARYAYLAHIVVIVKVANYRLQAFPGFAHGAGDIL